MFFSSLVLLQWVTFIFQYGRMNSLTIYEDGRRFLFLKTPVDLKMDLTMKAISRLHNKSIQKPEVDITMTLSIFIHCQCWRPRSRNKSWQAEEFKETTKKKERHISLLSSSSSLRRHSKVTGMFSFLSDGLHDNTCLRFGDRRKHGTEGAPPWGCSFGLNRLGIEPGTISPKARVNL